MTIHDDGYADGGEAYTDEEMLFISALDSCEWREHKMTQFTKLSDTLYRSTCEVCQMYVDVNLDPLPNQIDIGGTAVALNCN